MKNPKPIIVQMQTGSAQIRIVGFKDKNSSPYLLLETDISLGFIEDRDVKRLAAWAIDCLAKRPKKGRHGS